MTEKKHPTITFIFPEYYPAELSLAVGRSFQTSFLELLRHFVQEKKMLLSVTS